MTVSRFRVEGMDCAAEEQLVRMRLTQLDGITQIGVDLPTREVTVDHTLDTAALALIGNIATMVVLHGIKTDEAHLQASWIFTANDIKVNALVIVAAIAVALTGSAIPDLIAGAIIFAIVANGGLRILLLTRPDR